MGCGGGGSGGEGILQGTSGVRRGSFGICFVSVGMQPVITEGAGPLGLPPQSPVFSLGEALLLQSLGPTVPGPCIAYIFTLLGLFCKTQNDFLNQEMGQSLTPELLALPRSCAGAVRQSLGLAGS